MNSKLFVVKRNGDFETVRLDKITNRLKSLSQDLNLDYIDPPAVTVKVVKMIYPGVTTEELDMHAANETANMAYIHHDYALLAGRIMVNNLHKKIPPSFVSAMKRLHQHGKIADAVLQFAEENELCLDAVINHALDYKYRYFGYKTLENGYLLKINEEVAERIQHMLMRVAIGVHLHSDLETVVETYHLTSQGFFTHASPTLFAAGTKTPQLSSCFLVNVSEDSIAGIYNTLADCAQISKYGGGIGVSVHNVRCRGSVINSTNGTASGLGPMLRVYNNSVRHVDQGGKRKGAMAVYVEPWHADIYEFLDMKRNMGVEDKKARDLLYALWMPDLFMKRVELDETWSLMCPNECRGLDECYGAEFEQLYKRYENENKVKRVVKARDLFRFITECQVETGTPYILYKDACNAKSNQRNLGTIKSSNLCAEIVEYSSPNEIAVCNLASVCVNKFVEFKPVPFAASGGPLTVPTYNFAKLKSVTKVVARNLNKIIDINHYPVAKALKSNSRHRPIGVGIQGLADAFVLMRFPYESDEAKRLNEQIAETVYYAALEASCELAIEEGAYDTFEGSPASRGVLQYDMWDVTPSSPTIWDWDALKARIMKHGLRNSLVTAYMPTASTAQILGNNESFEPFTNNLYVRRVLAGDFQVINNYLVDDLIALGLYTDTMRNAIMAENGSVQNIPTIPPAIKQLYKTVWEMKTKTLIQMAADRGAFIDQSQSFNLFLANPSYKLLASIHNYTWRMGLKTGMYYLRTKPAADAIKFTVAKKNNVANAAASCSRNGDADCVSCSA